MHYGDCGLRGDECDFRVCEVLDAKTEVLERNDNESVCCKE
jgi:hypothetical protein